MTLILALLIAAALAPQAVPTTVRVSGRVLDAATNEPLSAAQVTLLPAERRAPVPGMPISMRGETNSDGVYALNVPPGRYVVEVRRPGFVPSGGTSGPAPITVGNLGGTFPDIRLMRGGTIAGRVLDDRGQPLPNILLMALRQNNARGGPGFTPAGVSAQTNDLGEFRLSGVPTGRFYVMARPVAPPMQSAAPSSTSTQIPTFYPSVAEFSSASPIDVTSGGTTYGIDLQILRAPTFLVSGVVVDLENRPVPGAVAALTDVKGVMASPYTATAQKNGAFSVPVPSGTYRLVATIPVIVSAGPSFSASLQFAPSQTLRPGEMVEVTVDNTAVTSVKVVVQGR